MGNIITVNDQNNNPITVEVLSNFKIDEYNKEYVVYTLNDDGVSENVNICISQIDNSGEETKFVSIPEEEVPTVLSFYDYVKDHICENR